MTSGYQHRATPVQDAYSLVNLEGWGRALALSCCGYLACMLLSSCSPSRQREEVVVYAASSLQDLVIELGSLFEERHGIQVIFNFAGSNILAQQIKAGPQADMFLSADQEWLDYLEERQLTQPGSRRNFLSNQLVVVAQSESPYAMDSATELATLPFRHLALADTHAVPAGRYAKAWLQSISLPEGSLWDAVAERIVPTQDVRAALALVESDPQVVGIVYTSDSLQSNLARVLYLPPPEQQPDILYGAVQIRSRRPPTAAALFHEWLFEPAHQELISKFGFTGVD